MMNDTIFSFQCPRH